MRNLNQEATSETAVIMLVSAAWVTLTVCVSVCGCFDSVCVGVCRFYLSVCVCE